MSTLATIAISVLRSLTRRPLRRASRLLAGRWGSPSHGESAVAARVERLLADKTTAYRIAQCREDYCGSFRLVYEAYLRAGLARPNPFGMRVTPYQLLETSEVLVAVRQGQVITTITLVRDGELGLPMESTYPEEVAALRAQGLHLAEVSCLADRRHVRTEHATSESKCPAPATAMRLMTLMAQLARARGVNQLLIAVHPRHARFYCRFTAFEPIGGLRSYHAVCDQPAVALALDIDRAPVDHPHLFHRFFGLPFPPGTLAPRPMPASLRRELVPVVAASYDGCLPIPVSL